MASKKLAVTISDELLVRMDDYAKRNGLTRSGLIAVSVSQYMHATEAQPHINKVLAMLAAAAEGKPVTPEEIEEEMKKIEK